jgi:hypothetical protein
MALALMLVVFGLGFVILQVVRGRAEAAEWLLGLFLLPFLVLLLRPVTWRSPVAMVADRRGLYFIGGSGEQEYSFVPWGDIGTLSIERRASGNGMIKTVVLGIRGESSFWVPATESRFIGVLLQPVQPDGYRRLPLGNMGVNPKRTLAVLTYLRQNSVSSECVTSVISEILDKSNNHG